MIEEKKNHKLQFDYKLQSQSKILRARQNEISLLQRETENLDKKNSKMILNLKERSVITNKIESKILDLNSSIKKMKINKDIQNKGIIHQKEKLIKLENFLDFQKNENLELSQKIMKIDRRYVSEDNERNLFEESLNQIQDELLEIESNTKTIEIENVLGNKKIFKLNQEIIAQNKMKFSLEKEQKEMNWLIERNDSEID